MSDTSKISADAASRFIGPPLPDGTRIAWPDDATNRGMSRLDFGQAVAVLPEGVLR